MKSFWDLTGFSKKFLSIASIGILFYMQWNNLFYYNQRFFSMDLTAGSRVLLAVPFSAASVTVFFCLYALYVYGMKHLTKKQFLMLLTMLTLLLRMAWIGLVDTPVQMDFHNMYEAAIDSNHWSESAHYGCKSS